MIDWVRRHPGPLLMAAFIVLQLLDVKSYPLFSYDEPLLNDAGWQLARLGAFRSDLRTLQEGFESRYLWQPPALPLSAAVSYFLFGLGIVQTRLPAIVFGGLGVWAIYRLVLVASGQRPAALAAAAMLFAWPPWIATAKIARMDTGAIFALLVATTGVVGSARDDAAPRPAVLFAYGLAGGAAALFHTVALPWCFGLFCVLLLFGGRRRLASALAFGLGAGLPVLAWLGYGLLTPRDFQLQFLDHLMVRTSGGGGLAGRLVGEFQRYGQDFARLPAALLLALVALYGFVRHALWRQRAVAMLLVLAAIVVLLHAVVAGKDSGYYTLYPTTLLICLAAIGAGSLVTAPAAPGTRRVAALVALSSVALLVVNGAALAYAPRVLAAWKQGPQRDYALQMAPLREILKPGDTVWGHPVAWFAVVDAGATLKASNWAERSALMVADPRRDKYVVVPRGKTFLGMENFRKVGEFGDELPLVFGAPLSDKSYTFDLWKSKSLD
ncbi:MAG: glycosyltransferase family 39 protein [Proteobacteria bacterium]|nr:glycosyltransferase family 39 protein [Pseudomonadota bacterium]